MTKIDVAAIAILLLAVALWAPVAVVADPCPDCGPVQDCCLASGCACCLVVSSVLTAPVQAAPAPVRADAPAKAREGRRLAAHGPGVFHVPRLPLA
jgi:hypothetical protein